MVEISPKIAGEDSRKLMRSIHFLAVPLLLVANFLCSCGSQKVEPKKIVVILPQRPEENAFWQRVIEGSERAARELGVDSEYVAAANFDDIEGQIACVDRAVAMGADGILIAPISIKMAPAVARARKNGVPAVTFNTAIESEAPIATLRFDNYKAGKTIGEWVRKNLDAAGVAQGKVLLLNGVKGTTVSEDRRRGFKDGLGSEGITILGEEFSQYTRSEGQAITRKWLKQHSDIHAILSANDTLALGAADVLGRAERKDVLVTGIDGMPSAIEAISMKRMHATINQNPEAEVAEAMSILVDVLGGSPPEESDHIRRETPILHSDNIEDIDFADIVFTGLKLEEISNLNEKEMTVQLKFLLWFRYRGDFDPSVVEFLNASETIRLNEIAKPFKQTDGDLHYRAFLIDAPFKMGTKGGRHLLGERDLIVRFHHQDSIRNELLYVIDQLGMNLVSGNQFVDQVRHRDVLRVGSNWVVESARLFEKPANTPTFGRPKKLTTVTDDLVSSEVVMRIRIQNSDYMLRGSVSSGFAPFLSFGCLALLIAIQFIQKVGPRTRWLIQLILSLLLLLAAEVFLMDLIQHQSEDHQLQWLIDGFSVLWVLVPAILLNLAFTHFIWEPRQRRLGQVTPLILKRGLEILVYTIAGLVIAGKVFEFPLTGLLASGGALALVLGLALQDNIANFFAGVALNIERPFKVGDWISIDGEIGKVTNMTWRTTRIQTLSDNVISVPNKTISDAMVENLSQPSRLFWMDLRIPISSEASPAETEELLVQAALTTEGVEEASAHLQEIDGATAEYLTSIAIREIELQTELKADALGKILGSLRKANLVVD